MKYIYSCAIVLAGLLFVSIGCHSHEDGGHTHSHGGSQNDSIIAPISYTGWANKFELFVEFTPLIKGDSAQFISHFTYLENSKPLEVGSIKLELLKNENVVGEAEETVSSTSGIFRLGLFPLATGIHSLRFTSNSPGLKDTFLISEVVVHADRAAAMAAESEDIPTDEISFLKEQVWKIDFDVQRVQMSSINEVVQTSGEILPVKGEEMVVSAKSSGLVFYRNRKIQEGRAIAKGEPLFLVNSNSLLNTNLKEKSSVAQAKYDKAQSNFERAGNLLEQKVIGRKEFEQRKMEYSIAEAELKTISAIYKEEGQLVTSPISGIFKSVNVKDGQFVNEGDQLAHISKNTRLILEAEVSQKHLSLLPSIKSANFKTPYNDQIHTIGDYNGRLISYGKILSEGQKFIPVLFELDNRGELIPGSYIEIFLLANKIENTIVIPKSAVMQDYSKQYVYVQIAGESYEKREVSIGIDDGVNTQIISGLVEGERIVTEGAYQIKIASMANAIPDHGHEH